MVSRLVVDSQETNMDTAGSKHGNLKFHIDWRTTPCFRADSWHELDFGINMAFCLSWKALDAPDDSLLLGLVLGPSKECLNLGLGRILGNGNLNHDVSGEELIRKVCNHLEINRDPVLHECCKRWKRLTTSFTQKDSNNKQ